MSQDKAPNEEHPGSTRCPRLHLDLYTSDREGEMKRLLGIGAALYPQTYDPEDDFRVLEDADGNLFCVIQI